MDNNVSSTSPVPIFVPWIDVVATYTQDTQTHSITSSVSTQTDSNLLDTTTTQTNQITSRNEQTQTFPALTSISIQTEHILTHNTSATDVDDDSSPELDNLEEPQLPQSPRDKSSRKRKNLLWYKSIHIIYRSFQDILGYKIIKLCIFYKCKYLPIL